MGGITKTKIRREFAAESVFLNQEFQGKEKVEYFFKKFMKGSLMYGVKTIA